MKSPRPSSSSSSTRPTHNTKPYSHHPASPPSPPRSLSQEDREPYPSQAIHVPFDDILPDPPASLSEILHSFQQHGNGDRALLLAILAAKQAEEERLSIILHTRLTALQLQAHTLLTSPPAPLPSSPRDTLPPILRTHSTSSTSPHSLPGLSTALSPARSESLSPRTPGEENWYAGEEGKRGSEARSSAGSGNGLEMLLNAVARSG